jgi:hypothetical protein
VAEERAGPAPLSTRNSPMTIAVSAMPAAREWLLVFMDVCFLYLVGMWFDLGV